MSMHMIVSKATLIVISADVCASAQEVVSILSRVLEGHTLNSEVQSHH